MRSFLAFMLVSVAACAESTVAPPVPPPNPVTTPSADSTVFRFVDSRSGDDSRDGLTPATAYRTIARALRDIPSVVDTAWTIQLAPGEYAGPVRFTRFAMPTGWAFPQMLYEPQPALISIRGPEGQPDSAVITAYPELTPCVSASSVLLVVRDLTCKAGSYHGIVASASTLVLHNLRITTDAATAREAIYFDKSTGYFGDSLVVRGDFSSAITLRNHSLGRPRSRWSPRFDLVAVGTDRGFFVRDLSIFTTAFDSATMRFEEVGELVYSLLDSQFFLYAVVTVTGDRVGRTYAGPLTFTGLFQAGSQSLVNAHVVTLTNVSGGPIARCFKQSYLVIEGGTYQGATGGADTDGTCRLKY